MALHLIALTTFESRHVSAERRPTDDEVTTMVTDGVRAVLYGYRTPAGDRWAHGHRHR